MKKFLLVLDILEGKQSVEEGCCARDTFLGFIY